MGAVALVVAAVGRDLCRSCRKLRFEGTEVSIRQYTVYSDSVWYRASRGRFSPTEWELPADQITWIFPWMWSRGFARESG